MSYTLNNIEQLFALHQEMKGLDFIAFMKRMNDYTATLPAPRYSEIIGKTSISTPSPPESVVGDEIVLPKRTDKVIEFVFMNIPIYYKTPTWVMLRNLYITNPYAFRLANEGHISGDDTLPHISIRVEIPYLHYKTGESQRPWITHLHIYYTEDEKDKRTYTHITSWTDSEATIIAKYLMTK